MKTIHPVAQLGVATHCVKSALAGQTFTFWRRLTDSLRARYIDATSVLSSVVMRLRATKSCIDGTAMVTRMAATAGVGAGAAGVKPRGRRCGIKVGFMMLSPCGHAASNY